MGLICVEDTNHNQSHPLYSKDFTAFQGCTQTAIKKILKSMKIWIKLFMDCGMTFDRFCIPKPTKATDSAFFNELVTASIVASNARLAAVFDISADSAIWSINSLLFTFAP